MIFNSRDEFYKSPFGAVARGTTITLRIAVPHELWEPKVEIYRADEWEQPFLTNEMENLYQQANENIYCTQFSIEEEGLFFYRFSVCDGRKIGADFQRNAVLDGAELWQLMVYNESFSTPSTFHGGMFYQIFPDRFFCSGKVAEGIPTDRMLHKNWQEPPIDQPDPDGNFLCNDYFGGNLQGIAEKMDYLSGLGVECLYLNPIFEAHANHRYNTADYMTIDPLLGTNKDFEMLANVAHEHGIKLILDGVFNHTGSDSIYFNKEKRYGNGGAYNDPKSPYADWYCKKEDGSYESWWGFDTLPNVNEGSSGYREFICGERGVIRYWLGLGADGFRLDVADELPDAFIEEIRHAIKEAKPDALLLGEVWEDASSKSSYGVRRRYFLGNELDSVMNYPWRTAILDFVRYGSGEALLEAICTILENYPHDVMAVALNSLSTHDVPRSITALACEPMSGKDREWQRQHNTLTPEQYYRGRQLFLLASLIQFTLPGCPCLYYGDEAGLVGYADPFNRGTYPWGKEDTGLVDFFRLLGNLRKQSATLKLGSFSPIWFDKSLACFQRIYQNETLLVVVNRGNHTKKIPFLTKKLEHAEVLLTVGQIVDKTALQAHSGAILKL